MLEKLPTRAESFEATEAMRFRENGYAVFENVLGKNQPETLGRRTDALFAEDTQENRACFPCQGSMIPVDYKEEAFVDLITNESSLNASHTLASSIRNG